MEKAERRETQIRFRLATACRKPDEIERGPVGMTGTGSGWQAEQDESELECPPSWGEIGPAASDAIPALIEAILDEDDGAAELAEAALGLIDILEEQA